MVALEELGSMAPGTSAMLRARRKDHNVKPNRLLDSKGSRGMLYENEELRLRTININADVEKGQQYIKKLRRENDHLRREIWNLRDQYDRLESAFKNKQQQECEEDEEGGLSVGSNGSRENSEESGKTSGQYVLSTVDEEPEDVALSETQYVNEEYEGEDGHYAPHAARSTTFADQVTIGTIIHITDIQEDETQNSRSILKDYVKTTTVSNNGPSYCEDCTTLMTYPQDIPKSNSEDVNSVLCVNTGMKNFSDYSKANIPDTRSTVPDNRVTLFFPVQQFETLTVTEIIDELEKQLKGMYSCDQLLKSAFIKNCNCLLIAKDEECAKILTETKLEIKGIPIQLENISASENITIRWTAIPENIPDEYICAIFSHVGDIIGGIRRRTYKNIDLGERMMEIKLHSGRLVPYQATSHATANVQQGKSGGISRRKSFRSQININLQIPEEGKGNADIIASTGDLNSVDGNSAKPEMNKRQAPSFFSKSTGVTLTPTSTGSSTSTTGNMFQFPDHASLPTPNVSDQTANSSKTTSKQISTDSKDQKIVESPGNSRRPSKKCVLTRTANKSAADTSHHDRKPSVNFKSRSNGDISSTRKASIDYNSCVPYDVNGRYYRERSNSDVSSRISICKRKLSMTGHEGSGKIPWCGCWGIGCC